MTSNSVFSCYANSVLKLPELSDKLEIDELGNEKPVTKIINVAAILKQTASKDDQKQENLAGQDANRVYMTGWLVNPMKYPKGCIPPFECDAIINNKHGRFFAKPKIDNPYGPEEITGEKITGWFVYG